MSKPKPSNQHYYPLYLHQTNQILHKNNPIKIIIPTKMQIHRDKGLYFYYDEKFTFQDKCPNKHYMLMQIEDKGDIDQTYPSQEKGQDDLYL